MYTGERQAPAVRSVCRVGGLPLSAHRTQCISGGLQVEDSGRRKGRISPREAHTHTLSHTCFF